MLVLDDAGVGDLALGVVDHGNALVVLLVERLGLKAQAAVLERAQLKVVERVDGAAVDRLGGDIGLGGGQLLVLHAATHLHALEHVGDHLGVAAALTEHYFRRVEPINWPAAKRSMSA